VAEALLCTGAQSLTHPKLCIDGALCVPVGERGQAREGGGGGGDDALLCGCEGQCGWRRVDVAPNHRLLIGIGQARRSPNARITTPKSQRPQLKPQLAGTINT
jgi:hypothetical protein